MLKSLRVVAVLFFVFLIHPSLSPATPPPEGVDEVLELMGEMEGSFEVGNWEEAGEAYKKIVDAVNEVFERSQLDDKYTRNALASLGKSLSNKDGRMSEAQFIRFQKQFFQFLEQFDYEIHPVLKMIRQYIVEEATEAYEKKDYSEVVSELAETANLLGSAKPLLMEKGIPEEEVDVFKDQVIALIRAGKNEKFDQMGVLLEQVRSKYLSFMERYQKK